MKRCLILILSALLLLLCVATLALWIRSYRVNDTAGWYTTRWHGDGFIGSRAWGVSSDSGGLLIFRLQRAGTSVEQNQLAEQYNRESNGPDWLKEAPCGYPYMHSYAGVHAVGFAAYHGTPKETIFNFKYDDYLIVVPLWFLAAFLGFLAYRGGRMAMAARWRKGCCPRCGYDLRATTDRCPECGTAVAPGQATVLRDE